MTLSNENCPLPSGNCPNCPLMSVKIDNFVKRGSLLKRKPFSLDFISLIVSLDESAFVNNGQITRVTYCHLYACLLAESFCPAANIKHTPIRDTDHTVMSHFLVLLIDVSGVSQTFKS